MATLSSSVGASLASSARRSKARQLAVGDRAEQVDHGRGVGGVLRSGTARRFSHARTLGDRLAPSRAVFRTSLTGPDACARLAFSLRVRRTTRTENRKRHIVTTTFRELGVLPEICDALERAGITTPFAIQEMTLSVALMGTDLIGQARTGTGKTLAFGIPVLQRSVTMDGPGLRRPAAGQAAGPDRRPDPRARAPGLQRPRPRQQGPRPARPDRLRRRRLRHPARHPRVRRRHRRRHARVASSTWPTARPSTSRTCTRSCSTRPTRCSTSASCPTWSASSA